MISSSVTIYIRQDITYKAKKFSYEYEFVSYRGELRFRGFELHYKGKIDSYYRDEWNQIKFLYPNCSDCTKLNENTFLKEEDLPENIRNVNKRNELVIPQDILDKAQSKTTLKVSKEFSRT